MLRARTTGWHVYVSCGAVARRLRAPLRETNSRRNDNGGATTQPLTQANQPTSRRTIQLAGQPVVLSLPAVSSQPPRYRSDNPHQPPLKTTRRGVACIATRPTNWRGCLLVELLRLAKTHPPRLTLTLSLSLSIPLLLGSPSRWKETDESLGR